LFELQILVNIFEQLEKRVANSIGFIFVNYSLVDQSQDNILC